LRLCSGAADALGEEAPLGAGERCEAAAYLPLDEPVEQQREADDRDEGGDSAVAVEEDRPHRDRAFEVGGAAFDQVLALVGREELVAGEVVVVADQAGAAVESFGFCECGLVKGDASLRLAVLVDERQAQEAVDATAIEDRLRARRSTSARPR
jgi:hypothetical protein